MPAIHVTNRWLNMVVFNTFVSFLQSFLVCVLCLIYDTNTSRINILKRFSSFSVPQWNIKTLRLYPLTGYKKHLQTRKRIWLVTSDLKRELGVVRVEYKHFRNGEMDILVGQKERETTTTHRTWESVWRWSCVVKHVETESYGRYENDRAEFFTVSLSVAQFVLM